MFRSIRTSKKNLVHLLLISATKKTTKHNYKEWREKNKTEVKIHKPTKWWYKRLHKGPIFFF